MSKQNPPQPRKSPKQKRLNISTKNRWNKILKEVEKESVPVDVLQAVTFKLVDGTDVKVNIKELINSGYSSEEVEAFLNEKLEQLESYIDDVDYFVNVDDVANVIQPMTDSILKDLK